MPERRSENVTFPVPSRLSPRLERYLTQWRPAALDDEAWALSRDAVLDRARACRPQNIHTLKGMLRALVWFLALTAWWDRRSPLDLSKVLVPEAIRAHAQEIVGTRTRPRDIETLLLRLARQQWVRRRRGRAPGSDPTAAQDGVTRSHHAPVDTGAAPVEDSGPRPSGTRQRPLVRLPPSASALRSLNPVMSQVGTVMPDAQTARGPAGGPHGKNKMSRAAMVAEGKRRYATALGALQQTGPAPLPVLAPDIALRVETYKPQGPVLASWDLIAPMCRTLARYYVPANPRAATTVMWHLSRYLAWVARQPHRVDREAALRLDEVDYPHLLERYEQERQAADSTVANLVSIVKRATLRSRGVERSPVPQTRTATAPHVDAEVPILIQYAHQQRTPTNRRSMCFIIGLSLGAGLSGHDLALVRRHHLVVQPILDGTDVLTVEVVDGTQSRVVVVSDVMRPTVELALTMHDDQGRGPGAYILGTETNRGGVVQTYVNKARAARPQDRPRVTCFRMRNTWLVAAMRGGIPVRELMQAAGLQNATTLIRLMTYCDPLDPAYVSDLFANVYKRRKR